MTNLESENLTLTSNKLSLKCKHTNHIHNHTNNPTNCNSFKFSKPDLPNNIKSCLKIKIKIKLEKIIDSPFCPPVFWGPKTMDS